MFGMILRKQPSPPFRTEREGPSAQRWEGEVGTRPQSPPPHPGPLRPRGRRGSNVAAALVGALLAAASAGSCPAQQLAATPPQVVIDNFDFEPAVLTVPRGTRVTWVNRDEEPHTVVSANKDDRFKSQALDTNDTFSVVFDKPGTYKYFCSIHTHMVGTIEVK